LEKKKTHDARRTANTEEQNESVERKNESAGHAHIR
jgi:hypothetical protein